MVCKTNIHSHYKCSLVLSLWERKIKYFLFTLIIFSGLLVLTKILGPDKLFESIFWQDGAALSFNFHHFLRVFLDSISKGLVIYTGLLCVFINIFLKKVFINISNL